MKANKYGEGDDVSAVLGIKKYDPQLQEENDESTQSSKKQSKLTKFLMNFAPFRYVYFKLNSKEKGSWPQWITKTDECRIQVCANIMMKNFDKPWYIAEKVDGQSGTFFTYKAKKWGISKKTFGCCSRNIWYKTPVDNNYWKMAKKYDLESKLLKYKESVVVQSEICGGKVQGNKYKFPELDMFVFNVIIDGKQISVKEMKDFCEVNGLKTVPILNENFIPQNEIKSTEVKDVVQFMVKLATNKSVFANIQREGIVCRLVESPRISLKVINPEFLLKFDE